MAGTACTKTLEPFETFASAAYELAEIILSYYFSYLTTLSVTMDPLCGLVVSVPVHRARDPGFDSRRYQIYREVVGLERCPLSLVRIIMSY
jgi:hypothetical protein